MQNNRKWIFRATLSMATLMAAAAPGLSQADAPSRTVRYEASSPNSAEGAHTLYRRLLNAANDVCGNSVRDKDLAVQSRADKCAADALAAAVRQIDSPQLARAYITNNGAAVATHYGIEPVLRTANR